MTESTTPDDFLVDIRSRIKKQQDDNEREFNESNLGRIMKASSEHGGLLPTATSSYSAPRFNSNDSAVIDSASAAASNSASTKPSKSQTDDLLSWRAPRFKESNMPYVAPPPPPPQASGGGSVICTEFYKLGLCEKEIYYCEHKWGAWLLKNDPFVMHGYYWWGVPLAKKLNRKTWHGRLLIKVLHPVFNACSLETAAQQGVYRPRSFATKMLGKITIALILTRLNRAIGKTRHWLEGGANVARA